MEERLKYLFQRYLDNDCTRNEFDEFLWYVSNSANNDAIREMIKKVYDDSGMDASSQTFVDESGNLVLTRPDWFLEKERSKGKSVKKWIGAMVAVVGVSIVAGFAWFQKQPVAKTTTTVKAELTRKSTERSEYKYLQLPDSTQVWLNAESSLDFPPRFSGDKRIVYLSGEAYFDVKHADKIPFVIQTGKVSTTVLGTAFNIKAYPGRKDVIVSVSRGKVKINFDDREVATLTKGQRVKVSNTDSRMVEKKPAVNEAASWQQGNLAYDDENMEDIIADLERVYDVRIRIENISIRQLRVSTSFKREIGVEQALQVLCQLTDTELKQADGQYRIQ
jgi:ferric-dicitrate binding protein FerR (iron transport regulator)